MGIKKKWSQEQRDQIVRLRLAGKSWPKIAKETGVPKSTVIGIWKEHSTEPEPPKLKQSKADQDKRIAAMLREMVVEEALAAMEGERDPAPFTLQEIADYIGVGYKTIWDIERNALNNLQKLMLKYEDDYGK